jgi:hypothetical protein
MRVLAAALMLASQPAHAATLIFQFWPTTDAGDAIFCSLDLSGGEFTAVEIKGMRMETPVPVRWAASDADEAAMTRVLGDLLTGAIPSQNTQSSVLPEPPFTSAIFWVPYDGGVRSGSVMLKGEPLPPALAGLIMQVLPGGLCAGALGP